LPFLAKRFETNYRAYRRRGDDIPPHPRYLAGVSEMTNAAAGHRSDPPRLVGDQERAKRVLMGGSSAPRLHVSSFGDRASAEILRLIDRKDVA